MSVEDGIPEEGQAPQPHDWERTTRPSRPSTPAPSSPSKNTRGCGKTTKPSPPGYVRRGLSGSRRTRKKPRNRTTKRTIRSRPPPDPRVRLAAAREAETPVRFDHDLQTELGETKVPKKANDWIKSGPHRGARQQPKKALKQAVEEFRAIEESAAPFESPPRSPPSPAKPGTRRPTRATANARRARMAAAIEAANQQ
jgi:hypothetical protein